MEFRLTYQGPLYAQRIAGDNLSRLKEKQLIRESFHRQLEQLWTADRRLNQFLQSWQRDAEARERVYSLYVRGGISWIPLVQERVGAACSLDILFLRREPKGGMVQGGDLDNRIKTLFDCLRLPNDNELPAEFHTSAKPNPFFCLLSDDQLITEFRVAADRLLVPSTNQGEGSHVHLVIQVKTFAADPEKAKWYVFGDIHE